jgi:hypothetical protein
MVDDTESYKLDSGQRFDHFSSLNIFCYLQISFIGFN